MRCVSGKHEWLSSISASRCCVPGWMRVLRLAGDGRGDASGGCVAVGGESARFVWQFAEPKPAEPHGRAL